MSAAGRICLYGLMMVVISGLFAGAVAAKPSGSGPGNSPNAKSCQKGGWENVVRGDGTSFASETECTSYAAKGGTLFNAAEARCLNGGWQSYVTSTGRDFASESDCVAYVRGGGTLVADSVVEPCLNGGWQDLARSDGSGFSSEDDCRSYAAGGGTLVTIGRVYQASATDLYLREVPTGDTTLVGSFGISPPMGDIATGPDGTLYGIAISANSSGAISILYRIDKATGAATPIGFSSTRINALDFSSNGVLYGASPPGGGATGGTLYTIDPNTGFATAVGSFGEGIFSDGDLAFAANGTLYATVITAAGSSLATVNPATGAASLIGPIGQPNNFGLVSLAGTLYSATGDGKLLRIDATTGAGTVVDADGPPANGLAPVP